MLRYVPSMRLKPVEINNFYKYYNPKGVFTNYLHFKNQLINAAPAGQYIYRKQ